MEVLKASGKEFSCFSSREENTFFYDDIFSSENLYRSLNLSNNGFLVIKNIITKEQVKLARDKYFSLFQNGEYKKEKGDWVHLNSHPDPHGCNRHPAKEFLKSDEFHSIVSSKKLFKVAKRILNSDKTTLCPRMIVRSFSKLSERCTYAHRDKDYFFSPNPKNVATCWIPLGSVGVDNGQLIYLLQSHKDESFFDKKVTKDKIISKYLETLSKNTNLKWYRPIIEEGDVIFHSLEIIHASFDSNSILPRLSIDLRYSSSIKDEDPRWKNAWRGDDGL